MSGPLVQHRQASVLLLLALAVGAFVPGCSQAREEAGAGDSAPPSIRTEATLSLSAEQIKNGAVRWSPAEATTMTETVEIPGHLSPNEDQTAQLSAPARGRVLAVHVRIGDRVLRGQPLVTLQSQDAVTARAEYTKAVSELNARQVAATYARVARERADKLLELKAMSRQEVERARTDADVAAAAQSQAEADLERARTALEQLGIDTETGNIVVRTPLTGVVLEREAVPGSVVDAGAHLVMVSDLATLWLNIAATDRAIATLRPGARVWFTVPAFPAETFEAAVQNVGAALDPATRTLPVRALVRNSAGTLRPEMFASVRVELGQARPGLAVASTAVQLLDQRPVVFLAHPDPDGSARFERRDVQIGARTNDRVQIVGGLSPGDLVVTDGAFIVKSEFTRAQMPSGS